MVLLMGDQCFQLVGCGQVVVVDVGQGVGVQCQCGFGCGVVGFGQFDFRYGNVGCFGIYVCDEFGGEWMVFVVGDDECGFGW